MYRKFELSACLFKNCPWFLSHLPQNCSEELSFLPYILFWFQKQKPYMQYGPIMNGSVTACPDAAVRYRYISVYILSSLLFAGCSELYKSVPTTKTPFIVIEIQMRVYK